MIAEGIGERLDATRCQASRKLERDAYGQVHLSDLPLGSLLRQQVRTSLAELGLDTTIVSKDIGYELRCAKPIHSTSNIHALSAMARCVTFSKAAREP